MVDADPVPDPPSADRLRRLLVATLGTSLLGYLVVPAVVVAGLWLALTSDHSTVTLGGVLVSVLATGVTYSHASTPGRLLARLDAAEASETTHPDLYATVRRLAATADVPTPAVWVAPTDDPNAFAVVRPSGAVVCVTRGLLDRLDGAELEAVLAHEVAHLANRDADVLSFAKVPESFLQSVVGAAFLVGTLAYLSRPVVWLVGLLLGTGWAIDVDAPFAAQDPASQLYLVTFGAGFALVPLGMATSAAAAALSRTREYAADAAAARLTGNPTALAAALSTLDGVDGTPDEDLRSADLAEFYILPHEEDASHHPSTADRIARLRALTAAYERR